MNWRDNPYVSLEVCSWKWKLAILSGESLVLWDISLSSNSNISMFCLTWVWTSVLTWVQTLLENVKTLMNHRVLTKLIHLIKTFKQLFSKCRQLWELWHHLHFGSLLRTVPWFCGYKSTDMILLTLYSPKVSQFEKISKLQLCSCNSGQFPELQQWST